jgi:small subunit ribosomal protein S2
MGMKVIAPLDTNCDPDVIDYPIPGNDDAIRSINLFCKEMAEAIIEGKAAYAEANGEDVDVVSATEMEAVMSEAAKEEAAPATKEEVEKLVEEKAAPVKTDTKTGDDLTKIAGVGKVYQGKLNDEGFHTFADVANMTDAQIQVMEEKYSFKGDFKEAVASAKELAEA